MLISLPQKPIYLLSAARTPLGRFRGNLSTHNVTTLGSVAIAEAVRRSGLTADSFELVVMGIVSAANLGQAPARRAALDAGLSKSIANRTVNTVCGSAMEAITQSIESILAGTVDRAVAGGMESRSQTPYLIAPQYFKNVDPFKRGAWLELKQAGAYRWTFKQDIEKQIKAIEMIDGASYDGLFWAPERKFMAEYAKQTAKNKGMDASEVNEYAASSHKKAYTAQQEGWFQDEIVPVAGIATDELMNEAKQHAILETYGDSIVSGYNTSAPADAGASVVLATDNTLKETKEKPLARILGFARLDVPAEDFLEAPIFAMSNLMERLEKEKQIARSQWGLIEANEAFGIQLPLFEKAFQSATINIHGGAIALGHPLGAAGARLTTTLAYAMHRHNHPYGMVGLCYGGGGAYALALEKV
jgi:acetyl-CoA C-acetyltransferase